MSRVLTRMTAPSTFRKHARRPLGRTAATVGQTDVRRVANTFRKSPGA